LREEELARKEEALLKQALQESLAEYSRRASEQADIEEAVIASTGRRQKKQMVYVAKKKAK